MIISHRHRFIFIKTEKTAGTSIEIALSRYCGPDDVITPIQSGDERTRILSGGLSARNYFIQPWKYSRADAVEVLKTRRAAQFRNHSSAHFVRAHVPPEIWETYFKFTIERNPWDKVISWYYWQHRTQPRPTISEFLRTPVAARIRGYDLYTISDELAVDRVFFFENLDRDMKELGGIFGLSGALDLPKTKSRHRDDRRPYREVLSDEDRDVVAEIYAREIALFGYTW